mmetsp:Transcript_9606/g.11876  ORF Transcript_9606/g.11876 Transcript_9606/m.11876 type:complete len:89 (+) Transcript_9606:72-338(+)
MNTTNTLFNAETYSESSSCSESSEMMMPVMEETLPCRKGCLVDPSNSLKKKKKSKKSKYFPFACCQTCAHFHLKFAPCNCRPSRLVIY